MSTEIYLGEPPPRVKEWIKKHHRQDQFNFLYKKEGDTEWQEWEPRSDDIQIVDEKVTVKATSFKAMDGFADVREVKLPNKWNNGTEDVDVTSIGRRAFFYRSSLSSVTIPDSVTNIGDDVFCGCSALTSVTIPDSVTNIGAGAFVLCNSLTSITIPESVTSMGNDAFKKCSGLTTVEFKGRTLAQVKAIPDARGNLEYSWGLDESVIMPEIVEDEALYITAAIPHTWLESTPEFDASTGTFSGFAEKANAVKVIIPSKVNNINVTSIGSYAFDNCSGLTSVTMPNSVTSIGLAAFRNCSGLTSVAIPDSVTSIGNYAFAACSSLTSVAIPDSVTSIGNYAFAACSSLTNVVIPDSLSNISNYAFSRCSSLSSVTIPDSVTSIWYGAFFNCSSLTSVTIPDGVKNIDDYAFHGCSGLSSVTIGNGVTSIGNWAFYNCRGLKSVTIGDSLMSIGDLAFYSCIVLTSVEFEGNAPTEVGSDAFMGVASGCKAVISPTATGFPAAGETWNGLIVEVKP